MLLREQHRSASRSLFDFKHAHRDNSPSETTPEEKEPKKCTGEMFVQVIMGQEVPDSGGIWKYTAVTVTMPDMIGKGTDLFDSILKEAGRRSQFRGLAGNLESFNSEDSLMGGFNISSKSIGERDMQIFPAMLQAIENVVIRNKEAIPEENLDRFLLRNTERKMKSANVVLDGMDILSDSDYGDKRAYGNKKVFGDDLYRIALRSDGVDMRTRDTPKDGSKIRIYDESLAGGENDHGDAQFIRAFLAADKKARESGAKSVFGIQINSTSTVADCAGNKEYKAKFDVTTSNSQYGNTQSVQYGNGVQIDTWQTSGQSSNSGNSSSTSSSVGDGDVSVTSSDSKIACSKCGKMNDKGMPICSCALTSLRKGGSTVSVRAHHH